MDPYSSANVSLSKVEKILTMVGTFLTGQVIQPGQVLPQPNTISQQSQCVGINEEYQSCGEACPRACDQLSLQIPSWCAAAGCASGCFCRAGYVRQDSRDPRSTCILPAQCQSRGAGPIGGPQIIGPGPFPLKTGSCPTGQLHPAAAQTLTNGQARQCNSDNDCTGEQRCCNTPPPLVLNSLRCLCPDPNSLWKDCGTSCPETCQGNPQICSGQCTPSCVCVDGYVKLSSNLNAPCVQRNQCGFSVGTSFGGPFGGPQFGGPQFVGSQFGGSGSGSVQGTSSFHVYMTE